MARKRTERLYVMVTLEEKNEIIEKMKSIGMTNLGEFVRKILLMGTVIRVDTNGLNNLAYEVSKVGNNINQIAKHANQTNNINPEDIELIIEDLNYIKTFIANFYKKINKASGGK